MSNKDQKYEQLDNSVALTDAERTYLASLRAGETPLQAQKIANLTYEQASDLMERAKKWEIQNMCVPGDKLR